MGKPPPARKYGAPLYAAAWPTGSTVYVAGGGGKKSSGIKNRVVAAVVTNQTLSDEVAHLQLEDCPIRMAAHPAGKILVLALGGGGLCRIDLTVPEHGGAPVLALATGEEADRLAKLPVAKALAFSSDGRRLAVGGEDASVIVLDWPSAQPRSSITAAGGLKDGVRDMDFSAAHQNRVLAIACEDGSCGLWDWEKGSLLLPLQLPESLRGGSFSRCRFARDGSMGLFTVAAHRGDGFLLHWEQNDDGDVTLKRKVKAANSPITAFDIGGQGSCLAVGTSEGDVFAWSTQSLSRLRRGKAAHMVFTTAAVMSPDDRTLLTVSADASAVVTGVQKPGRGRLLGRLTLVLLVVLAFLVWYISSLRNVKDLGDVQHLVEELAAEGDQ
mmetsp:Transcript_10317/g.31048  ORF Transcript_10317/g.31048 Transcript_10317/m.31048 type:complete len:383 (-) Transcript_10317:443-1591(-)